KRIALLLILFVLFGSTKLIAQESDSTTRVLVELLTAQIERIAESSEENLDYADLIETYFFMSENKINLNSTDIDELRDNYLISAFQLESLKKHLKQFGPMLSVYELELVDGFDVETIALLQAVVTVDATKRVQKLSVKNVFKYGRHQVISRVEGGFEEKVGYSSISDSALWDKPSSRYLGSSQKIYTKYGFNYRDRVRAGITLEKDAGEVFLKDNVNDSIQKLLGDRLKSGFDFTSLHIFVADMGPLKALALGDYHLAFGQGITMWSGLAFGKSTEPTSVMKYGQGLKPNTSVNENYFLRGAAATFGWKRYEFTFFYSQKDVDASTTAADTLDGEEYAISSLQETGLHRTTTEIFKKGVFEQTLIGGRAAFKSKNFELGYTIHQMNFNAPVLPTLYPYNYFRFRSDQLMNQGLDFRIVYPKIIMFGELGRSDNGGLAGIGGFTAQPAGFISFTMAYRNYQKDYQNYYSNSFSEGSSTANEKGMYAGVTAGLAPGWKLSAYADYFTFPWLGYYTDAPSYGHDYYLQLDHVINRNANFYFRYRTKQKMTNDNSDWNYVDYLINYTKNSFRFHINYRVSPTISLKNRVEYIIYDQENEDKSNGYVIYQDILYRPTSKPYEITFRYAIFDTDTYDSRVYTYENDVLYAFSIPGFYDRGSRMYLLLKVKAYKSVDLWARIAQTWYSDRTSIGSGLDLIEGNTKTDFKLQLRWKF
ncbi:MAG: hypothetical protein Q8T08_05895, partial [Ignavibacteria bacterium]|nr:hypothetical protein [Ignavibacteria bacterium]